ncbi:MAG: caspase family protein [Proteobacteria bacterium]|nr:caspase family protein [Pseudomonadota bacterium]
MRRLFAAIFVITFACGALTAALLEHTSQPPTPAAHALAQPQSANDDTTGDDDAGDNWPDDADTPEQVIYAQPAMLRAAVARLAPRVAGKPNLYFIGFAGDAEEDVFLNEAEYAHTLFARRFGAAGHELLLVNNPATLSRYPLATLTNLETAVEAVAAKMDRDNDILFVLLTSHGTEDHLLYVAMDPLPLDQIAPEDLADVFTKAGIRFKVIVVSACYSGGFIDALKNDTTMIVTAARADRASFGCGTDSDITDFGRAFLVDGLNHNATFTGAFAEASKRVDAQETRQGDEHSHPQLVTTPRIEAQLKAWRDGITIGPPVPFIAIRPAGDTLTVSR